MMKKVPKRRFKGFLNAGDWEQRKLGEVADIIGGGTPSTSFADYWDGDIDWYSPVEIDSNRYVSDSIRKITKLGLEKSSTKILPVGTVLFTSRAGIGNTAILRKEGCTNQGFQSIIPRKNILDTYFLYTLTPQLKRYGEIMGAGSTFVEVSGRQMEKMPLNIPSLEEQKKVGKLFEILDDSITLHQRKLEKLQATKKALLYELFPIENSRRPKRRFKGFTGDWEQRKLEGLCDLFTDGDWIESKDQCGSGVRLIQTGNIGVTEYLDKPDNKKWISDETFNQLHCKEVFPGDILISRLPEPAGRACIIPHLGTKMITAVDCTIVRTSTNTNASFLVQYLSSQPYFNEVNKCLAGGTRQRISRSALAEFKVLVPSEKAEQDIIGKVFDEVDSLITLHQRKLEKLKNLKAAYLNEMFV